METKVPVISVIMSIYDEPEEWLNASIQSILNQTFRDFEFIITNDNPKRLLNAKLLNKYKVKDERIIVVNNKENIGLTKSLNKALRIAKGKFIARMDGDDISLPNRFELQIHKFKVNENLVLVGTQGKFLSNNFFKNRLMRKPIYGPSINWLFSTQGNPIIHSSAMFRSYDKNEEKFYYDESLRKKQDFELWSRLLRKGKVTNINNVGIYYRLHENQTINSYNKEDFSLNTSVKKKNLEYIYKLSSRCAEEWANYLDLAKFKKYYLKKCIEEILPKLANLSKKNCYKKKELIELKIFIGNTYGNFAIKAIHFYLLNHALKAWLFSLKYIPIKTLTYYSFKLFFEFFIKGIR